MRFTEVALAVLALVVVGCGGGPGGESEPDIVPEPLPPARAGSCNGVQVQVAVTHPPAAGETWANGDVLVTAVHALPPLELGSDGEINFDSWGGDAGECLFMGGRLELDFSQLDCEVRRVDFEVAENCSPGSCTTARAYVGNDERGVVEGLGFELDLHPLSVSASQPLDSAAVQSAEAYVCGATLY